MDPSPTYNIANSPEVPTVEGDILPTYRTTGGQLWRWNRGLFLRKTRYCGLCEGQEGSWHNGAKSGSYPTHVGGLSDSRLPITIGRLL